MDIHKPCTSRYRVGSIEGSIYTTQYDSNVMFERLQGAHQLGPPVSRTALRVVVVIFPVWAKVAAVLSSLGNEDANLWGEIIYTYFF